MTVPLRPLYVVSDAHLGAQSGQAEQEKSERLLRFWRRVEEADADLIILGDLFDFWFEYRNAIPRHHFEHLMALGRLTKAGHRVWYVAGNHDFWAGPFLRHELGVTYCEHELELDYGGRRLCFAHGDGWRPAERGYRILKAILRNRISIALYRLIPPDIAFPLARAVSAMSRKKQYLPAQALADYARIAHARLEAGLDALVIGHLHETLHRRWPVGEWVVTGDWIKHFSYVRIDTNGVGLWQWQDEADDLLVPVDDATEFSLESVRAMQVD